MLKSLSLLLCSVLCIANALAQPIDTLKKIDEFFSSWNNSTPGGAVMVARGKQIIYDKAFGLADLEHNVPNVPSTIFEAGSVSKQFTAMAALLLVKEGKLSLQDDVRKYIPELPAYPTTVRVKHLLNHTSGLKDWGSVAAISGWPRTTKVYTQDLALQIICRQSTLNFTPGAEYSYSNSNYTVLVFIVERVSGKTLSDFTKEKLFEPAGMTNTKWRSNFREVVPGRSIAYQRIRGGYDQSMPFEHTHGHGGLLTTTTDLIKWNSLLESRAIGGDDVYKWRTDPGKLNNGAEVGYGAGLSVGKFNGASEISHSGATAGYRAWLAYYPSIGLSVVILSNDGNFNAPGAGHNIAGLFIQQPNAQVGAARKEIKLSEVEAAKWAGVYRSIRGFDTFSFETENQGLKSNGKLLKASHRDSLYLDDLSWIALSSNKVLLKNPYDTTTYVRVSPPDFSDKSFQSLAGTYYSDEAETTFGIHVSGNKLIITRKPFRDLELEARFKDGFLIDGYDLVEFKRNKKGSVTGFDLSTARAQRIKFVKTSK